MLVQINKNLTKIQKAKRNFIDFSGIFGLIGFMKGDYILKACANIKENKSVCSINLTNQEHNI